MFDVSSINIVAGNIVTEDIVTEDIVAENKPKDFSAKLLFNNGQQRLTTDFKTVLMPLGEDIWAFHSRVMFNPEQQQSVINDWIENAFNERIKDVIFLLKEQYLNDETFIQLNEIIFYFWGIEVSYHVKNNKMTTTVNNDQYQVYLERYLGEDLLTIPLINDKKSFFIVDNKLLLLNKYNQQLINSVKQYFNYRNATPEDYIKLISLFHNTLDPILMYDFNENVASIEKIHRGDNSLGLINYINNNNFKTLLMQIVQGMEHPFNLENLMMMFKRVKK